LNWPGKFLSLFRFVRAVYLGFSDAVINSTKQPFTVAGEAAGIRNFLSERHRNSCFNASGKPIKLLVNGL
jgi:hypothetical protein